MMSKMLSKPQKEFGEADQNYIHRNLEQIQALHLYSHNKYFWDTLMIILDDDLVLLSI